MQMTGAEKAKNLKIAYIGGGSRGWAWGFMKDLAMDGDMCGTIRLYDIDRSAAERNRIIGGKISAHPKAVSRWEYEVSDTLREALTGVDFVVISILPATFEEMRSDVHLPERVGVYQPVGDTVGPGGFMRAMRTIPMYVEIAEAIRISRKCMRIVRENIVGAIGIKVLVLVLSAIGMATMELAIFADVGVMILAVLNAMRALRVNSL